MIDFRPANIGYIRWVLQDATNEARARSDCGTTGSASAYHEQVKTLKRLRDRILSTMPDTDRASYPDYEASKNG